jgi:PIN domain nuclease of toxin-antitoxin system
MKILIDTQSVIWFAENNAQLTKAARAAIEDTNNICYVSLASFWEMSIKMNLGKLVVNGLSLSEFMDEVDKNDIKMLDIKRQHILENERLPLFHRDPFDRLIIAQAITDTMHIVSSDSAFDAYPVTRIW